MAINHGGKRKRRALIRYIGRLLNMMIHYFMATTTKLVIFVAHIWAISSIPVNEMGDRAIFGLPESGLWALQYGAVG